MKTKLILIVFFGKCLTTQAQQYVVSKYSVGVGAGVFVYQGDLTPQRLGAYNTLRPAVDMYLDRAINSMISVRANLAFGSLNGDDSKYGSPAYRQQRNFRFHSPLFEFSGLLVVALRRDNKMVHPYRLSPYVFGGAGVSVLRTRRDYSAFNAEYFATEPTTINGLELDARHSVPGAIPVIPLGAGVRYSVSPRILITLETTYRATFTDYLDGFSQAANDRKKDSYQSHTIGIVYRFVSNNSMKCPVF